jgi:hypothetical protein
MSQAPPTPDVSRALPAHWRRATGILVVLLGVSVLLVFSYVRIQNPLSPFDEWVYSDYLDKVTRWGIPQTGEQIDQYAFELSSCRGIHVWGPMGSSCGGPYRPEEYPFAGVTSADIHPPTYFVVTAAAARAIMATGVTDDLLTAGRLVGAIWLAAGLLVFVLLAREVGAPTEAAIGMALVLAALPVTRYSNTYLTPDAANTVAGAGVVLLTLVWQKGRVAGMWLIVAGVAATAIKAQNLLAVFAAAGYLLLSSVITEHRDERGLRRSISMAGGLVAAAALPIASWLALQAATAYGPPPEMPGQVPFSIGLIIQSSQAFIQNLILPILPDVDPTPMPLLGPYLSWLILGSGLGSIFYLSVRDRRAQLAMSTAVLMLIGGPMILISTYLVADVSTPTPPRYGASLLPALAAVGAAAFTGPRRRWILFTIGTVLVLLVLSAVWRAG